MCDSFSDLRKRCAFNKKELLELINELPDDVILQCDGPDIGGYDVSTQQYVGITYIPSHKTCTFGHFEAEAYEELQKGNITRDQFELLADT